MWNPNRWVQIALRGAVGLVAVLWLVLLIAGVPEPHWKVWMGYILIMLGLFIFAFWVVGRNKD